MERKLLQQKNNKNVTQIIPEDLFPPELNPKTIEKFLSSLEVAEMIEKQHCELLKDIRKYNDYFSLGKIPESDFFTPSTYTTNRGKTYPCYLITKKGCEFIANKTTGVKGAIFTARYINRFHEMENQLQENRLREGKVIDTRFELAKLIVKAPESRLQAIRELYPEYFSPTPEKGSLEYVSDVNTSYLKWKEEYNIDRDWIGSFPTVDVYNNYMRYCVENRLPSMGKKVFYKTLENDFYLTRKQKYDGHRYFIGA